MTARAGHKLVVHFEDGTEGCVSIENRLFGPMFEPLRDGAYFAKASVNQFGTVAWPNGLELDAEALYMMVQYAKNAKAAYKRTRAKLQVAKRRFCTARQRTPNQLLLIGRAWRAKPWWSRNNAD